MVRGQRGRTSVSILLFPVLLLAELLDDLTVEPVVAA